MEITKGSDLILILQLEDIKGRKMRVSETAHFKLYVWTANRNNYLVFNKRDINTCGQEDKIAIPDTYMECLESGVICYTYDYAHFDAHFKHTDCMYNKVKEVVTDLYWRNCNLNQVPANPVNYQTLEYLKDEIEKVRLENEREIGKLTNYISEEYTNKLEEEIKRSNQVDIEIFNLIKSNKLDSDTKDLDIQNKLDSEIRRSNEVDVEMFNLIKSNKTDTTDKIDNLTDNINTALNNEIARATTKENEIATNLQTEVNRVNSEITNINNTIENETTRAKGAEQNLVDSINRLNKAMVEMVNDVNENVDKEESRAKASERLLNDAITAERDRATEKEDDLKNKIKAVADNLNDEIDRSLDRDREHKQEIDIEVNRAKAEENRIDTLLTNEINRSTTKDNELTSSLQSEVERAKTVEKDITEALQNLKTSVSNKNTELSDALNTEISRAKDKEDALKADIDAVNSAVNTNTTSINTINQKLEVINGEGIGSIKHGVEDSKHYTDDEIAKVKSDASDLSDKVNDEITRAKEAEKDIDSALKAEVKRSSDRDDLLSDALNDEIQRAKDSEKVLTDDLASEVKRSTDKDAEHDLAIKKNADDIAKNLTDGKKYVDDEIGKITKEATDNFNAIYSTLNSKANSADVYNKTEIDKGVSDINIKIDSEIARAKTAEKANADAIAVITGEGIGSIKHSFVDSKHYTDDEVAKLKASVGTDLTNTLKDYATKQDVDNRIQDVIGTAPEALDTLGEIADALGKDSDAISAINGVLAGKVNKEDVYTKSNIDTVVAGITSNITTLQNSLSDEISRSKDADKSLTDSINAEVSRAIAKDNELTSAIADEVSRSKAEDNRLSTDLNTEIQRAKDAEKLNSDKIDIINGDVNTIGSIAHAVEDAKHYVDDEVRKLNVGISDEVERATKAEKEIADSIEAESERAKTAESELSDSVESIKKGVSVEGNTLIFDF